MPTKVGVVFLVILMRVGSGCAPGVSRPCYAAWWPGDCSGSGRDEDRGGGLRFFMASMGQWGDGLPPLSPCYGRSASGYRKHTRGKFWRIELHHDNHAGQGRGDGAI